LRRDGDLYDGRGFVKSARPAAPSGGKQKHDKDIDLDVKLGTVVGLSRRRRCAASIAGCHVAAASSPQAWR